MIAERESRLQSTEAPKAIAPSPAMIRYWAEQQLAELQNALRDQGGRDALRALFADERLEVAADGAISGVAVLDLGDGDDGPPGPGGAEPLWCPGLDSNQHVLANTNS